MGKDSTHIDILKAVEGLEEGRKTSLQYFDKFIPDSLSDILHLCCVSLHLVWLIRLCADAKIHEIIS